MLTIDESERAERYLGELADGLPRRGRRRILVEIRYHFEAAVAAEEAAGASEEDAESRVIERPGPPALMVERFATVPRRSLVSIIAGRSLGRHGAIALVVGAAVITVAAVAVSTTRIGSNRTASPANPTTTSSHTTFAGIIIPGRAAAKTALGKRIQPPTRAPLRIS